MKKMILVSSLFCVPLSAVEFSGAVTAFYLTPSDENVKDDYIGVLDLDIEGDLAFGRWHVYVEGTSTTNAGRVTDIYGEALADAGAASDGDGKGRVQLSNIEYYMPVGSGELVLGLLYPSGFTESGDWTNDETSQFVSSSFVNIQTSAAPDYALGFGYYQNITEQLSFSFLLSQAQGLGDLDGRYSSLFDNVDDYFTSAELVYSISRLSVHGTLWSSSLEQESFNGGTEKNHGGHLSIAYDTYIGLLVARAGYANDKVSEAANFIGLSWQKSFDEWAFGAGVSQSYVSNFLKADDQIDDLVQIEVYIKYQITDNFHVTGSLQKIENSGFTSESEFETDPTIFTLRTSYEF